MFDQDRITLQSILCVLQLIIWNNMGYSCFIFFVTVELFSSRAALYSIQQLRGELTSISDQPSSILMVYFKVCF